MGNLSRSAHRKYAQVNGYFWLPCPVCGMMFGGHEWNEIDNLPCSVPESTSSSVATAICPTCTQQGYGYPHAFFLGEMRPDLKPLGPTPEGMIEELRMMSEYQKKGNAYSTRIVDASAKKYHTDAIFHNRVLLAVDIIQTATMVGLERDEFLLAKAAACVALYLKEEDDSNKPVMHFLSRTNETGTVCNVPGFVSSVFGPVNCPDCQRLVK
ncbi:MAG: hypothetical protein JWO15_3668 [Sphingomonadales bacterium]|nr:hypothetical protein [Sphingomonadales bacterium]